MRSLFTYFFLLLYLACHSQTIIGKVVGISDGDTFTLLDENKNQIKIRLHGIDCPESDQAFGQVAKKELSNLIFSKEVTCIQTDTDRYGRIIAKVYTDELVDLSINEILLQKGLAWHFKKYDNNVLWSNMENDAKVAKVGLWIETNPICPSDYRKSKKDGLIQN